jgi:hypothetical protein
MAVRRHRRRRSRSSEGRVAGTCGSAPAPGAAGTSCLAVRDTEWHEFAGDDLAIPHATSPAALTLPTLVLDRTDVADIIRSAWQVLTRFNPEADDSPD